MRLILISGMLCCIFPFQAMGYSLQQAEEDLRDHRFEQVLTELASTQFEDKQEHAYALYLLGTAAFQLSDYEKSLTFYQSLIADFPESTWFGKATYRKAECLMFLKRYPEAEMIYAKGAEELLSEARRSEIAGLYIQHADRFYAPAKRDEKPDYDRARTLYQRALEILPQNSLWERASFQTAMTFFLQENWSEAQLNFQNLIAFYDRPAKSASAIIEKSTDTTIPNPYPPGGYRCEALLNRGEAYYRLNNLLEARRIWHRLREVRNDTQEKTEILAEAAFRIAKTYGIPEPAGDHDLAQGIRSINEFVQRFPEHPKVPEAVLNQAKAYFFKRQYESALKIVRDFLQQFDSKASPQQQAIAEFLAARCLVEMGQYEEAIAAFETFLKNHSVDENWREAQQAIVSTQYRKVKSIQKSAEKQWMRWNRQRMAEKKDPEKEAVSPDVLAAFGAAREGWEMFQQKYPLDERIPAIQLQLGKNERMLQRLDEAIGIWKDLVARFPQSDPASEGLFLIAEISEKERQEYEKALDLYQLVTFGSFQGSAQSRIDELKQISLAIRTDRTFRTNESPAVHLTTRNIEQLTLKIYPLDLQTYFQSQHTILHIEDIDINLIAPERIWQVTPEAYQPYKLIEQDLPIEVKQAGAWVVQVESATWQAVTLLLVSDMAIAIQGGHNEVLVYAEDQRQETPIEKAHILLSDGKSIIAQGETNREGVWQVNGLKTDQVQNLSVFAFWNKHWAGEILNIDGLSVASSLQPRMTIYTDRVIYEPGDTVHFRAVVRDIENGHYVVPRDFEYKVLARDFNGVSLYELKSTLSEFGTISGQFTLDRSLPPGTCQLILTGKEDQSARVDLKIQNIILPKEHLTIETEQTTYFYGDKIAGTIRFTDFSGNPIAGEKILYLLDGIPTQENNEGITNERGEIPFHFKDWDLPETGTLSISCGIVGRSIFTTKTLKLVTTEYKINLDTPRPIYLTNEPFHVSVSTQNQDEKQTPFQVELAVHLQKQNEEGAFETVETRSITTVAEERHPVSVSFQASIGGKYRIVAEGKDRRGTTVSASREIELSGEDDDNKLLILTDRDRYQQGETATFTVVSRVPDNYCLLTGEREGIVEYRLQKLQPGKNILSWKLDERYSPQAKISILVMSENRIYRRDVTFQVYRGLDIAVTPNLERYAPRDEAELTIATRDHTGKPIMTELSLGLIDAALLAIFPDAIPDLVSFFDQTSQGSFLRSSSSVDFRYEGITRPIDETILAERAKETEGLEDLGTIDGEKYGLRFGKRLRSNDAIRGLQERVQVTQISDAQDFDGDKENAPALDVTELNGTEISQRKLKVNFAKVQNADHAPPIVTERDSKMAKGGIINLPAISQSSGEMMNFDLYFAQGGGEVLPRSEFPATAYFNPAILTDENGKATVRVKLPDTLTTWEIQARGITKDTLASQSKKTIVVDRPYRVELDAPPFLTEGDRSSAMTVIRNHTGKALSSQNAFMQTHDQRPSRQEWSEELQARDRRKHSVSLVADFVGDTSLTLISLAGDERDAIEKSIPIYPWGVPIREGEAGIANQSQVKILSLPSQTDYSKLTLSIATGGTGDLSLLAEAWSSIPGIASTRSRIERGLAALAALDCAEQLNRTDQIPVDTLRKQVMEAIRQTSTAESEMGLWAWSGTKKEEYDLITTGRATEFLRKAQEHGYSLSPQLLENSEAALSLLYQKTADDQEKARILYAWSGIRPPEFTFVNRIHRNVSRLSEFDAALLGLTWINMGRPEKAREVLDVLLKSPTLFASTTTEKKIAPVPPVGSSTFINRDEILALAARLYFQLPASARDESNTERFLHALMIRPLCRDFLADSTLGLRIQALAAYLQSAAEETGSFTLSVKVNGHEATLRKTSHSILPYERIEVNPEWITSSNNRVELQYSGEGKYRFEAILEGWTKQDVRPQDWMEAQDRLLPVVERTYQHGPLMYKQNDLPRGYDVVEGSVTSVSNQLEEIRPTDRINVQLQIAGSRNLDYLVVEDHLPAGFTLVENSMQGPVDRYEQQENRLFLHLRGTGNFYFVHYQLRGYFPGEYRVPSAWVTLMEDPGHLYTTLPNTIRVLPEGVEPQKPYNPTPDELYHMGLRLFDDRKFEEAKSYLTTLFNTYPLKPEPYLETARKLFQIHLQGTDSQELVRYFEILKERDQEFEIQFDHIAKLARAYRNIGEQERAVYVYRSLFDGLFLQEGAVSGTLQEVNRHREALDYMKQLILEYPDIPSVQTAVFTTGSILYQNINRWLREPDFMQSSDRTVSTVGNKKKRLLSEAVGMIESFLALYPNHPAADEAGYTLINLWLDEKQYETAARLTESFAKRFPQSTYLDSFDYLGAYTLFQLERYPEALALSRKVSTADYPAPGGGMKKSDEVHTAILMSGKILHAAGDLKQALKEYERVKDTFGDAGKSVEFLTETGLMIPETTTVKIGKPATIPIRHKNLDSIELRVYPVDLMAFYLTERSLNQMTQINLAGIQPTFQQTLSLQDAPRFEWNEKEINLDLDKPGAYLVVVESNGQIRSGMVIRSDLDVEVQEDSQQGLVRVNVQKEKSAQYATNAKVQIRGSENTRFESGETDLRGIFTAQGIQGIATVLIQDGSQYAFYQGTSPLGMVPKEEVEKQIEAKAGQAGSFFFDTDALLNNTSRFQQVQEVQNRRWIQASDPTNNRLSRQKAQSLY